MNTVQYYAKFDQAGWQMIQRMGAQRQRLDRENRGFVDVRVELEFLDEMVVNDPVLIECGIERIGSTSFTYVSRMRNVNTGRITSRGRCTTVHFDLKLRQKVPLPDDLRASLEAHLVTSD